MPFEIPQQEPQVEVGPFQREADAILYGCKFLPRQAFETFGDQKRGEACALGAWRFGRFGVVHLCDGPRDQEDVMRSEEDRLKNAYLHRYKTNIATDNDSKRMTREQIAERIAALR